MEMHEEICRNLTHGLVWGLIWGIFDGLLWRAGVLVSNSLLQCIARNLLGSVFAGLLVLPIFPTMSITALIAAMVMACFVSCAIVWGRTQ